MEEDNEIILLEYYKILKNRKMLIWLTILAFFTCSLIISFLLPKKYTSTASILPPQQESSFGAGIMSQLPVGLGSFAGGVLGTKSPSDLWVGILKSRNLRDALIDRFDLIHVLEKKTPDDARAAFDKMIKVTKSKEDIISISVEDNDPKRAAAIANAFIEELERINKGIVMTSGKRTRVFVEERLNEAKDGLTIAENNMRSFQEKNRAVKLDDQSKAIIEALGTVKGQLIAKELELKMLLSYATPNNPYAEILKTQVDDLKGKLRELEDGKGTPGNPASRDIFIPTSEIPGLMIQYARLLRDAKVQQTLYELLTQQYEMSRIQEAKDTPTVQVLDIAKAPEKKSKPNRTIIVLLSTITAVFFGIFMAIFLEYIEGNKESMT